MKDQIEFTFDNDQAEALYCPTNSWEGTDSDVLTLEMPFSSTGDLEQLYQEAKEYDFLTGKTALAQSDNSDEEIE